MSNITRVAFSGDSGTLGSFLPNQLVDAGFKVTILTLEESDHSIHPEITYKPVDYNSLSSLSNALEGQDALVSPLDIGPRLLQLLLVEAAAKAHVKRYIPGVFRANSFHANVRTLPICKFQVQVHDALEKEAFSGGMTYSVICTGPILDVEIKAGTIMNLRDKTISIFDGGNHVFSTTTLPTIGKAVISVLTHPEETKNRVLFVQDTATTLQRLVAMGENAIGADGWRKIHVSVNELVEQAYAEMNSRNPGFAPKYYQAAFFGRDFASQFERNDNEMLGLGQMSHAEVQRLVDSLAE
ncbi:hypothetical protein BDR22DRAFT_878164 [Usnea florida]